MVDAMKTSSSDMPQLDDRGRAFLRLYAKHEHEIYAYVMAMVPNWADADEIMQETCVRLWDQFGKFELGTNFVAWGRTIARYMVLAFRKRTARERVHFSQAFVDALADEVQATSDQSMDIAEQRKAALALCIDGLTTRNRDLLFEVYSTNQSIKVIAEKTGRPIQGAYQAISRIRKSLFECISRKMAGGVS